MVSAENRLKGQAEFSRVLKEGLRFRGRALAITAASRKTSEPRIGIMVSKKVVKKAVDRNRVRRIIAHLFRSHVFVKIQAYDVVVFVSQFPPKTLFAAFEEDVLAWQKSLPSS
jgi:ribonuclease P protein component